MALQTKAYRCACEFGRAMGDNNPFHYPRIGIADNVLYRGNWIVEHRPSGTQAVVGVTRGTLAAEADDCCFAWFDRKAKPPPPPDQAEAALNPVDRDPRHGEEDGNQGAPQE